METETGELPPITDPAFVLFLGPSGVGKSKLIEQLSLRDPRIVPTVVYTDRSARENDFGKVSVSPDEFTQMEQDGKFLSLENAYGNRYGILASSVLDRLSENKIPIQDYLEEKITNIRAKLDNIFTIYVVPPSFGTLHNRLGDGRDPEGGRYAEAKDDLLKLKKQHFKNENIDGVVISKDIYIATKKALDLIYKRVCR